MSRQEAKRWKTEETIKHDKGRDLKKLHSDGINDDDDVDNVLS